MPAVTAEVQECSVDGGKIRLRTPKGEPCVWQAYKGVRLHEQACGAWFGDPSELTTWVNQQPLAKPLTCLGDGHPGIWNIIGQIACKDQRREVLDGYHLVENLHKAEMSEKRRSQAEVLLWQGKVTETLTLLKHCRPKTVKNFCDYLREHQHRIINYRHHQSENICSIGSGAVESMIKQIDRRTKISGAQWKRQNVPQVLAHRCAYLNGSIRLG